MGDEEHWIDARALHEYHGGFGPRWVDDDGTLKDGALDLEFHIEKSISFECECGKRFYKEERAAEHLHEVSP